MEFTKLIWNLQIENIEREKHCYSSRRVKIEDGKKPPRQALSISPPAIATSPHHSLAKKRMYPCGHNRKFLLCEPNKFFLIRIVEMKPVQRFLHTGWKTTPWKEAEFPSGIQLRGGKLRLRPHDPCERNLAVPRWEPASGALIKLCHVINKGGSPPR